MNDAIHALRNRFTVVRTLERLEESLGLFSYFFPWLSEDIRDFSSLEYLFNDGNHHHDTMNMNRLTKKNLLARFLIRIHRRGIMGVVKVGRIWMCRHN